MEKLLAGKLENSSMLNYKLLLILMLIVFLDIGNFFLPMPIYTPLFYNSSLLSNYSFHTQSILLGLLVSSYGFAQLFGAPLLGQLSDYYSRKQVLMSAMFLAMLGCVLSGVGVMNDSLLLLFISRIMIGFASGTIAIVFTIAASLSQEKHQAKNFGYINLGISLGVIISPLLGGYFSTPHSYQGYHFERPFFIVAAIYLISFLLIWYYLPNEKASVNASNISAMLGLKSVWKVFNSSSKLKSLILAALFFQLGTESFYLLAPIQGVKAYHMASKALGLYFLCQGITAAVASLFINSYISNKYKSEIIYKSSAILLTLLFLLSFIVRAEYLFVLPFLAVGIFGTLCWIHINNLFAQTATKENLGICLGVSQALWSLGGIFGAAIVGFSVSHNIYYYMLLPLLFEAISLFFIQLFCKLKTC